MPHAPTSSGTPAERGHAIGHQERVAVAKRRAELRERVLDAGGGLGVHDGHHRGRGGGRAPVLARRSSASPSQHRPPPPWRRDGARSPRYAVRRSRTAPRSWCRRARADSLSPSPSRPFRCSAAAGRARPHAVDAPQHRDDVEQDVVQVGVEVTEHRAAHRVEHRRVHVRRAGAAQKSLRRLELGGGPCTSGCLSRHRERKLRILRNT